MNKGFRIEIQSDLLPEQRAQAEAYAREWTDGVNKDNGNWNKRGGGGRSSFWRRGILGLRIGKKWGMDALIFRRISKHRRVFAIVKLSELTTNYELGCFCPKCAGGMKVTWIKGKPETYLFYEQGEIKG